MVIASNKKTLPVFMERFLLYGGRNHAKIEPDYQGFGKDLRHSTAKLINHFNQMLNAE
jgi:hypothetical protein